MTSNDVPPEAQGTGMAAALVLQQAAMVLAAQDVDVVIERTASRDLYFVYSRSAWSAKQTMRREFDWRGTKLGLLGWMAALVGFGVGFVG